MKLKSSIDSQIAPMEQPLSTDDQNPIEADANQSGRFSADRYIPMGYREYEQPSWAAYQTAPWKTPVDYDDHAPFPGGSYGVRLLQLEEIAKTIANSSRPFFRSTTDRNGNKRWRSTSLGELVSQLNFSTRMIIPDCPQTAYVKLVFKHLYALGLQDIYFTSPGDAWNGTTDGLQGRFKTLGEIFNELARVIQLEAKTQAFQDRIAAIDGNAFEVVLLRESQAIKDLQEVRERISKKRDVFLQEKCGIYLGHPAQSKAERDASRRALVQVQLNRFAIARLSNAKKLIERQLVIAQAWQGILVCRL